MKNKSESKRKGKKQTDLAHFCLQSELNILHTVLLFSINIYIFYLCQKDFAVTKPNEEVKTLFSSKVWIKNLDKAVTLQHTGHRRAFSLCRGEHTELAQLSLSISPTEKPSVLKTHTWNTETAYTAALVCVDTVYVPTCSLRGSMWFSTVLHPCSAECVVHGMPICWAWGPTELKEHERINSCALKGPTVGFDEICLLNSWMIH